MKIPPAMKAMGAKPEQARALILFTFGVVTNESELAATAERVEQAVRRLKENLPS